MGYWTDQLLKYRVDIHHRPCGPRKPPVKTRGSGGGGSDGIGVHVDGAGIGSSSLATTGLRIPFTPSSAEELAKQRVHVRPEHVLRIGPPSVARYTGPGNCLSLSLSVCVCVFVVVVTCHVIALWHGGDRGRRRRDTDTDIGATSAPTTVSTEGRRSSC